MTTMILVYILSVLSVVACVFASPSYCDRNICLNFKFPYVLHFSKTKRLPKVEKVVNSVELGEGPYWDATTQSLYFVDILGKAIHKYNPAARKHTYATIGTDLVSLIIPVAGQKDKFVISEGRKLSVIGWDGKTQNVSQIEQLYEVENNPETIKNRINDGKCDPSGRLWAGTMGAGEEHKGALYSFGPNKTVTTHLTQVGVSNGLAWSPDSKHMYYIDSQKETVDQYDFNITNGKISNPKTVFTITKSGINSTTARFDGVTVDTHGNLWIAVYNGSCVIKVDPRRQTLVQKISLPTQKVTSVAFGGSRLNQLYVTTGRTKADGVESPPPDDGGIYVITGTGSKGFAGVPVKL